MTPALVRHVLFPLHERLRGRPTVAHLAQMEASQWWSSGRLAALQWDKLRKLLAHAYETVPYYRDVFTRLGARPEDIREARDLERLPYLTKPIIREHLPRLMSTRPPGTLLRYTTGGSTGEPLIFYTDRNKEAAANAAKLRARRWWGIEVGDRQIDLWGSPIELSKQDRVRILKDRHLLNFVLLSAFDLTEASIARYLDVIRAFRPALLYGYATVFHKVARFCQERGIEPDVRGLKAVITTSETLHDHQRETIAKVFGRPVANEYGCRDGGFVAHECPFGHLHVAMEHVYLEFLPTAGAPDGTTEVVITNLDAWGMPFIRYRVGDLATPAAAACPCGRALPLLRDVQGRTNDMLVSPTGRLLHSLSVVYVLREIPGLGQFKVTQDRVDRLVVEMVTDAAFDPASEDVIRRRLVETMGAPVHVDLIRRDQIQPEASGKYRWVVSRVEHPV
jgi:phenylacetate-CoA ligase